MMSSYCVSEDGIYVFRFTQSFNRTNLVYSVKHKKPKKVLEDIVALINAEFKGETGIVYCLSRYNHLIS